MKSYSISKVIFTSFIILLVSLLSFSLQASDKQPTKIDFSQLIASLDNIQHAHNIPAYAIVVSNAEKAVLDEVRGVESSGSTITVSNQAYFRIGSITKNFVSLAAVIAEKRNLLRLSDKVTNYLSPGQFKNSFKKQSPLTLEQLLEHSGGFPDMGRREFASNDVVTLQQGLQRFAKDRTVRWRPGQMHSYSNISYGLAGGVLEIATKSNINDWLTRSVFGPLGMESATMESSKSVRKNLVPGYQADGVTRIPYWNMIYSSLGAINLQPRDMAKLVQFYLKRGANYLSETQIKRIETPVTTLAAKHGLTYGYGLGIYQWYRDGFLFYGHGGDADGYLAHFAYQKEAGLGYFVVINTFNGRAKREMQKAIELFITQELDTPTKVSEVKDKNIGRFAGIYEPASFRFSRRNSESSLSLKWEFDRLLITENDQSWEPLVYLGDGLFRRQFELGATAAIFLHEGKMWFQGDEGNFVRLEMPK